MGFRTEVTPVDAADTTALASRLVTQNERMIGEMRARLPRNRELLNKIFEYGLQPV
jgi:hypothetical protein